MKDEDKNKDQLISNLKTRIAELEGQKTDKEHNENTADSEQRLRLVLEATNDGYWDWNPMTGETFFSPRYYTMLGYEPDEFPHIYESWRSRAHPDDVERIEKLVQEALENHTSFSAEFRMKAKNGSWRWLLTRGKAVEQDDVGRSVRMVGTHTDITERKQIENNLIESEAYNKILFRESWIANVVSDPETGKFIDCNPAAAKIYGYSNCSEVIGKTPLDMSAPFQYDGKDSAAAVLELDKIALDKGHHTFLWKHQRPDGTIWDGEVALFAFIYKQKKMLQFIVQDITERKKAQDALKKSNLFLSRSQKVGKIGSFVLDIPKDEPEAQTWESTPELDRIFGIDDFYPRTGESWLALIVQRDEVAAYFSQQVFKKQKRFEKEYQIVRPANGEVRWIFGRGELEFDDQGQCIRMIGTVQDITERKQAEELLRLAQFIFEKAPIGIWRMGTDGRILDINEEGARCLGYGRKEVRGRMVFDFARGFTHEDWKNGVSVLDTTGFRILEHHHERRNGEIFPVQVIEKKMRFGQEVFHIAFVQDITNRKANEEALRKRDRLLHDVGRQAKIGGWEVDLETGRVTNTDEVVRIYELEQKEDIDVDVGISLYYGDSRKKIEDSFNKLAKDGTPYDLELEIISAKGNHKWVHTTGYPVMKKGRIAVAQGLFQDITDRKQMELEREKLIAELQTALAEIKELRGILPICANCKKIRDDKGYWTQIESYIHEHSNAEFSHGICPDCAKKLYPELYE